MSSPRSCRRPAYGPVECEGAEQARRPHTRAAPGRARRQTTRRGCRAQRGVAAVCEAIRRWLAQERPCPPFRPCCCSDWGGPGHRDQLRAAALSYYGPALGRVACAARGKAARYVRVADREALRRDGRQPYRRACADCDDGCQSARWRSRTASRGRLTRVECAAAYRVCSLIWPAPHRAAAVSPCGRLRGRIKMPDLPVCDADGNLRVHDEHRIISAMLWPHDPEIRERYEARQIAASAGRVADRSGATLRIDPKVVPMVLQAPIGFFEAGGDVK